MADICHIAGLIAAGIHPSPVKYADFITTTTHKTLMGPRGAMVMCREEYAKDVDRSVFPGIQGGPFMNVIAAKAVCFKENMGVERKNLQKQIVENSKQLAKTLSDKGLRIVSGGTDNHLMLIDLQSKGITGKLAETALNESGITVNKNTIPFDPEKPFITSGLRLGTPCVSTRGMKKQEMVNIGELITNVIDNISDDSVKIEVSAKAAELSSRFPIYK